MTFVEIEMSEQSKKPFNHHCKQIFERVGFPEPPQFQFVFLAEHHHDRKYVVKVIGREQWVYAHLKKHVLHVHYTIEEVVSCETLEAWRVRI